MFRRRFFAVIVLAVGIVACAPPGAVAAQPADDRVPAQQVIQSFDAALIGVMKAAKTLGYRGRYEKLAPLIKSTFNLPVMAQVAVGPYWDKFTPAQRARLVNSFTNLTIANYASRFDGFTGETISVMGETRTRGDAVVINTEIVSPGDQPVAIRYIMRPFEDGWKIVDVLLKGAISELATKRSEYASILGRGGYDALIAAIDRKVQTLAAG